MAIILTILFIGLVIFTISVSLLLKPTFLQSILFALALAVGVTPEFLPMIISVTLANGAIHMAKHEVIVKRLAAIHNFGSIDILCCDKTGTLTQNALRLINVVDIYGYPRWLP